MIVEDGDVIALIGFHGNRFFRDLEGQAFEVIGYNLDLFRFSFQGHSYPWARDSRTWRVGGCELLI